MARINLRPWRDELRTEKQRKFLSAVLAVAILGVLYLVLASQMIEGQIGDQQARNEFLGAEIATLKDKISEIEKLRQRRDELIERMRVIQELQGNRPVIVRVFDELVRTMPDGLYITKLGRVNDKFNVMGKAESNNRISSFMRRLDGSEWFAAPNLTSVTANNQEGIRANDFVMDFQRKLESQNDGNEG